MIRLMMIAENPKIIMRSLKKGKATTVSLDASTCFFASILLKKINKRKQILQMNVNFEKNEIIFISENVLKNCRQNNINLSELFF